MIADEIEAMPTIYKLHDCHYCEILERTCADLLKGFRVIYADDRIEEARAKNIGIFPTITIGDRRIVNPSRKELEDFLLEEKEEEKLEMLRGIIKTIKNTSYEVELAENEDKENAGAIVEALQQSTYLLNGRPQDWIRFYISQIEKAKGGEHEAEMIERSIANALEHLQRYERETR